MEAPRLLQSGLAGCLTATHGIGPDVAVVGRTGGVSESRYGRPGTSRGAWRPQYRQTSRGNSMHTHVSRARLRSQSWAGRSEPDSSFGEDRDFDQIDFYPGIACSWSSDPWTSEPKSATNQGIFAVTDIQFTDICSVLSKWSGCYNKTWTTCQCNSKENSVNRL